MSNNDLPALTIAELNRAFEDLTGALADYTGIHGDRLHTRLQAIVDQLHARAELEGTARSMSDDELATHARLLDTYPALGGVVPAAKAIVRGEQARRRQPAQLPPRADFNPRPPTAAAPHSDGTGCPPGCCGAGVRQWR
ncbi:hypothetical protein VA596_41595 [Amycolatopsis sp., V23-08]|uniref:Uncharacterized protein n=1 Tax=Amycolatopsis heterodermiae TaxID=3110235 RepID=A0ABU5RLS5_9PSEU|nr:hypothetical protein [Amycolatopsis sp., V23-08]MEA5366081.1 hypothetical protein [Amycolatopsis sp., V23-08]